MDRVEQYRQYVQALIQQHSQRASESDGVETQVMIDTKHDHYQILRTGWHDDEHRVYACLMHIDIKDGKIWIQYDDTEEGIATDLLEAGVPSQDIVLGFRPPEVRPYTEFATA